MFINRFKAKPGRFCAGLNGRKPITFLIPGLDRDYCPALSTVVLNTWS